VSGLRRVVRPPWIFVVLAVAALSLGLWFARREPSRQSLTLARYEEALGAGEVATADLGSRDGSITGTLDDGTRYRTSFPAEYADELVAKALAAGVPLEVDNQRPSIWSGLLVSLLPTLLIIGVLAWLLTAAQGGRGVMSFGKAKDRRVKAEGLSVTFADVAGNDEAVEELEGQELDGLRARAA
jgi:cell division protease FtsH